MTALKPCPFCGSETVHVIESNNGYCVACRKCETEGPWTQASAMAARSAWESRKFEADGAVDQYREGFEDFREVAMKALGEIDHA
jgi:Lar family restriction alleviation protein